MYKNFKQDFQKLLDTPEFKRLKRTYVNISMFNFFTSEHKREEEVSTFIAWLLNPSEAHGSVIFFEKFIEALIETDESHRESLAKIDANDYIWDVEVNTPENKFIDIFGTPLVKGLPVIVIENKIKAGLSGDQLKFYRNYANKLSKINSCESVLVLMDASDRGLLTNKKGFKGWTQLSYEWIGVSINSYLQAPCPPEVSHILRSYLTEYNEYFQNDYSEFTYWEKSFQDIKTLHKKFPDLVKSDMYQRLIEAVGNPNRTLEELNVDSELRIFFKYYEIFQDLCDFNDSEALSYSASNSELDIEYETYHQGSKNSQFYVEGLPCLKNEDWAIYISYQREKRVLKLCIDTSEGSQYTIEIKKYFKDLQKEIDTKFDEELTIEKVKKELHARLIILSNRITEFKSIEKNRRLMKQYEGEKK